MHREIDEALFVIPSENIIRWKGNNKIIEKLVSKNSVIRVESFIHTVENRTNEEAAFLVFRMVPDGTNKREIIKNDKVIFSDLS